MGNIELLNKVRLLLFVLCLYIIKQQEKSSQVFSSSWLIVAVLEVWQYHGSLGSASCSMALGLALIFVVEVVF